jgi:hypothetical protein
MVTKASYQGFEGALSRPGVFPMPRGANADAPYILILVLIKGSQICSIWPGASCFGL